MNAILLQSAGAVTVLKCGCDTTVATNWQDVAQSAAIAIPICAAIAFIAWIAMDAVLSWKDKEDKANDEERKFKKEKENEESKRKQKSDLLDKYLDFLKDQTKEKEFVTMEELEKQRKSFVDGLLEYLKNDLSLYLSTDGENAKDTEGKTDASKTDPKQQVDDTQKGANNGTQEEKKDPSPKETSEDKPKVTTQPKAKDEGNDNNEKKKQSLYNLIEELKKYIHPEKLKPADIDQAKIERYRKTLEYLIQLSQKGKLDEFSNKELDNLLNNSSDEKQTS